MKRLLLFGALGILAFSTNLRAQNRVLVEEFTSSTCGPCAATDPIVEAMEGDKADEICIVKWHQNYPNPGNDPSYFTQAYTRSTLYGVEKVGIPAMSTNGDTFFNPGGTDPSSAVDMVYADMGNYFTMNVAQSLTKDSVIALVTVTTSATLPADTALRLGVIVAERFMAYTGTNGRPYHTSVARTTIPGLSSKGAFNYYFSQAPSTTKTYRFATAIKSQWNRTQIMVVAAIQGLGTVGQASDKPVYQAAWTVPNITVEQPAADIAPISNGGAGLPITITNHLTTAQKVRVFLNAGTAPADWNVALGGLNPDGTLDLPADGSKEVTIKASPTGPALGMANFVVTASTVDSVGIGGALATGFGVDNKNVIVNNALATATAVTKLTNTMKSLSPLVLDNATFQKLPDWNQFTNIFYLSGDYVGIFNTGLGTSQTDRITDYLNQGGHFVLTSDGAIGYTNTNLPGSYQDWWPSTFKIDMVPFVQTAWSNLLGIAGDKIGDGIDETVTGVVLTQPLARIDNSVTPMFYNENGDTVGVRTSIGENGGKAVYLSFELENIGKVSALTTVMSRLLDYLGGTADVKNTNATSFILEQNYPNPFNPTTSISYTLTEKSPVTLTVQDMLGREVARLVDNKTQVSGPYSVTFDASKLASGSYVYSLSAGEHHIQRKMTLTK